jgi:hypothetical protein
MCEPRDKKNLKTEDLEREKLRNEVKEGRFWFLKEFAPYITILVTAAGLTFTWAHQESADRAQRESETQQIQLERERLEGERAADREQAKHLEEQIQETRRESDANRKQSEDKQAEERFEQAIGQLGSALPMQRVGAVYTMGEFSRIPRFEDRAASSLATSLEIETDPSTEEALFRAFEVATPADIESLTRANIKAQVQLARSFGRYVGIEMGHKFPGDLEKIPSTEVAKQHQDYERRMIIDDPVRTVAYHRRPVEEIVSHEFIRDAYWIQSFPDTMRDIFDGEKDSEWDSPAKDYQAAKRESLEGIRHSVRYLELTSTIMEDLLHKNSGHLKGWKLRGVYFVVADFRNLDLRGIDFSHSRLQMADLRGSDLSGANCEGTDFDGVNFSGAKLINARLKSANLDGIQPFPFDSPKGHGHTFISPMSPEERRFDHADFSGSDWREATLISPALRDYLERRY